MDLKTLFAKLLNIINKPKLNILLVGTHQFPDKLKQLKKDFKLQITIFDPQKIQPGDYKFLIVESDLILYKPSLNLQNNTFLLIARFYGAKPISIAEPTIKKDLKKLLKRKIKLTQYSYTRKEFSYKNIKTSYIELGNPLKTPLIFLHGLGSMSISNLPLLNLLAQKYFVIAIDLPYLGSADVPSHSIVSSKSKLWNYNDFALYIYKFIQSKVKLRKYVLAGHSFGGAIATTIAYKYPNSRLERLMLFNPAGLNTYKTISSSLYGFLAKQIPKRRINEKTVLTDFLISIIKLLKEKHGKNSITWLIELALKGNPDLKPHSINTPATLFLSKQDEIFNDKYKLRFAELFNCAQIVQIDTDHSGVVKPEKVGKEIVRYMVKYI